MKRLRQIWKRWMERKVSVVPATDTDVVRASIGRYFKYNQPDSRYVIEDEAIHHTAIDRLRGDGWIITLEIDAEGNLFYAVQGSPAVTKT